jgi:hypothetical protein
MALRPYAKPILAIMAVAAVLTATSPALAWGDLGHEVTALIAYRHLTPTAKAKVDALLAADTDTLTASDFASRATWADKYRNGHRETAEWHFIDLDLDQPDLPSACFGFPTLAPGQAASRGPTQDCLVNKIGEFEAELKSPRTVPAERILALKFLIHFVGDLHQPLHASDHQDRGGNCIALDPSPDGHSTNLHAYWDTGVIYALGGSVSQLAFRLDAAISPAQAKAWTTGDARTWAMESYALAKKDAYALPSRPRCTDHGAVGLSPAYQAQAKADAALQLEKAGIRISAVLNQALGA